MTYNIDGMTIHTRAFKAEVPTIPVAFHFVYQLPIVTAMLYFTNGSKIAIISAPVALLWALYWINRAN